jgi:hypothetical protein
MPTRDKLFTAEIHTVFPASHMFCFILAFYGGEN